MEIKLKQLETIFKYLFKRAQLSNIDHIKLDHDFYWNIDTGEKFDITKDPRLNVGSLHDDLQSLQLLLERKHAASVIDIERLGNLLIYMSEYILKSEQLLIK